MEVAQAVTASTVSSRFTWTIENFTRLNAKKYYSNVLDVGGYQWRVLIFPKGNKGDHLSMYLDVSDSANFPYGWSRYAQFSFAVINQIHNRNTVTKDTKHQFNARESDWGFTSFMPLSELYDPGRGYLVNDTVIVEAKVAVLRVAETASTVDVSVPSVEDRPGRKNVGKEDGVTGSSCVICLDAPVAGACVPCGHMAGCMSCLEKINAKKWGCPVCRAQITQVMRLYAV